MGPSLSRFTGEGLERREFCMRVVWENVRSAGLVALFVLLFRSVAFAGYHVPSESMLPTLTVGDQFYAAKFAYGFSRLSGDVALPLPEGRLLGRLPERGDVVVLLPEGEEGAWVKRVIGLPGDRVQLRGGRLFLNGAQVERRFIRRYAYRDDTGAVVTAGEFEESLPGGVVHRILEQTDAGPADDTPEYRVPAGHVFLMGDNRDNSRDSRFAYPRLGFVPLDRVVGKAEIIAFSRHPCHAEPGLTCPGGGWRERLLRPLG
jgi:signal peptidase I